MNKFLLGLALFGFLGLYAQADVLRAEMGGGIWKNELSGTITSGASSSETFNTGQLNYKKESTGYLWMFIKHPLPILPNLRLEYTNIDYSGTSAQSFIYKNHTYQAGSTSDLTLDQFDIIMYYNILDNTAWTTIDLGLDVKVIQAEFNARDSLSLTVIDEKETLPIPMAYGRLRFEVPLVDIGLEGMIKYSTYKSSKVMDYIIKADYTLTDILPVDVGFEVGYRFQKLDIDGSDFSIDTTADIEIDGVFAGAVIRF